jgi:hypothetical protein
MTSKLTVEAGVITFTEELDNVPQFYPGIGDTYFTPSLDHSGCECTAWCGSMADYQRMVGKRVFETAAQADAMQTFILRLIDFALN